MKRYLALLLLVAVCFFLPACGGNNSNSNSNSSLNNNELSSSDHSEDLSEPKPANTQHESGKIGDYEVSIVKSEIVTAKNGKDAMLVTFSLKNNSNETVKFTDVLSAEAYQNNTACHQAGIADDKYDIETMIEPVAPGETKDVYEAYFLQDNSNVTVRVCKKGQTPEEETKDETMVVKTFNVE